MVREDSSRPKALLEAPSVPTPEPPAPGVVDREAWIDFMLEGTFPASDPPAWTSLREREPRRVKS
jgi:hypothetical protein